MSVGFSERVDIRPYSGYSDPSLPIGAWVAQAGRAGDATGGTINLDFLFKLDENPQTSELFSLEQMSIDITSVLGVHQEGSIETFGMDTLAPNRDLSNQKWHFSLKAFNTSTAMELDKSQILPLWLGAPNRIEGDSGLRLFFVNTNLILYQVILQGYMWGPRAVMAPGGPRRPVGGLFGAG